MSVSSWTKLVNAVAACLGVLQRHILDLERLEERLDAQERVLLMLQPQYHTLMHTFKNEAEAEMAWTFLHMALYGPETKIPPMPVGPQYTSPYMDSRGEPWVPKYTPQRKPSPRTSSVQL